MNRINTFKYTLYILLFFAKQLKDLLIFFKRIFLVELKYYNPIKLFFFLSIKILIQHTVRILIIIQRIIIKFGKITHTQKKIFLSHLLFMLILRIHMVIAL